MKKTRYGDVDVSEILPGRIKELREALSLSQEELARAIEMPLRSFQRIEHGESKSSLEKLLRICDVLDTSIDKLLQVR